MYLCNQCEYEATNIYVYLSKLGIRFVNFAIIMSCYTVYYRTKLEAQETATSQIHANMWQWLVEGRGFLFFLWQTFFTTTHSVAIAAAVVYMSESS